MPPSGDGLGGKNVTMGCWSGPLVFFSLTEQSSSLPPRRKEKAPTFSQLGPGGDRDNHGLSKDATELTVEFRKRQNSPYHVTMGTDWKWS